MSTQVKRGSTEIVRIFNYYGETFQDVKESTVFDEKGAIAERRLHFRLNCREIYITEKEIDFIYKMLSLYKKLQPPVIPNDDYND
jgi:hypothetical protein